MEEAVAVVGEEVVGGVEGRGVFGCDGGCGCGCGLGEKSWEDRVVAEGGEEEE